MATLRQRTNKDIIAIAKNLDAFRKLPEEYTETSQIGGTLSLISRLLIVVLIIKEVSYFRNSNLAFKFKPDTDLDKKLHIHMDVTIAMPCRSIGADIVDSTNQNLFSFGALEEEDTWWDLCPVQRSHFEAIQHMNDFLREEYHSIAELIFKDILMSGGTKINSNMPERSRKPKKPYDACRIHGTLTINKVAGNFHITAGKSLHIPQGHVHITSLFDDVVHNFSHRINRFSFGEHSSRIVQPLEGDERIFNDTSMMAQYFIDVVPTEVHGFMSTVNTFQYSVKENIRPIDHYKGSHGIPGLYFKYDVSALKVIVRQDRDNIIQFLVRLCSSIAGIVIISGIINTVLRRFNEFFVQILAPEAVHMMKTQSKLTKTIETAVEVTPAVPILVTNDLIINANRMTDNTIPITTVAQ